jgi:hypothetical protein
LGRELVTLRSEGLCGRTISGEEPLSLCWRLEALHTPFSLTAGLMRMLYTVIEIPMVVVFHAG